MEPEKYGCILHDYPELSHECVPDAKGVPLNRCEIECSQLVEKYYQIPAPSYHSRMFIPKNITASVYERGNQKQLGFQLPKEDNLKHRIETKEEIIEPIEPLLVTGNVKFPFSENFITTLINDDIQRQKFYDYVVGLDFGKTIQFINHSHTDQDKISYKTLLNTLLEQIVDPLSMQTIEIISGYIHFMSNSKSNIIEVFSLVEEGKITENQLKSYSIGIYVYYKWVQHGESIDSLIKSVSMDESNIDNMCKLLVDFLLLIDHADKYAIYINQLLDYLHQKNAILYMLDKIFVIMHKYPQVLMLLDKYDELQLDIKRLRTKYQNEFAKYYIERSAIALRKLYFRCNNDILKKTYELSEHEMIMIGYKLNNGADVNTKSFYPYIDIGSSRVDNMYIDSSLVDNMYFDNENKQDVSEQIAKAIVFPQKEIIEYYDRDSKLLTTTIKTLEFLSNYSIKMIMFYLLNYSIELFDYDELPEEYKIDDRMVIMLYDKLRDIIKNGTEDQEQFPLKTYHPKSHDLMTINNPEIIERINNSIIAGKRYVVRAKIDGHANIVLIDNTIQPAQTYYVEPTVGFRNTRAQIDLLQERIPLTKGNIIEIIDIKLQQDGYLCYTWCLLIVQIILINLRLNVHNTFKKIELDSGLKYGLIYVMCYLIYQQEIFQTAIDGYEANDAPGDVAKRATEKWKLRLSQVIQHGAGYSLSKKQDNQNNYVNRYIEAKKHYKNLYRFK